MSEQTIQPGTELIPAQEVSEMRILITESQSQLAKATEAAKNLPTIVDDATKAQSFAVMNKAKDACTYYKEQRMPFTRKLNEIVKTFTATENAFTALADQIQVKADKWAAKELEKSRAAKAKADADLKAEQSKIELEGRIREVLRQKVDGLIDAVRQAAGAIVGSVTKETLEECKAKLTREPKWIHDKMDPVYNSMPPWVTDKERFMAIATEEMPGNVAYYISSAGQILTDSLAILPVAVTNKAEADRLQTVAREEDEKKRAIEAEQQQRDVDMQKAVAELDAEVPTGPKVRIKANIKILHNEAWMQMFAFWWKRDPIVKDGDLSKKTLAQIKRFCEEHAYSTGELIEHSSLEYIEVVKAK